MARASDDYNLKQDQANTACNPSYINAQTQIQTPGIGGSTGNSDEYVVDQLFTYHPSNPFVAPKYDTIREAAKYFAKVLLANVPRGSDRTAAIRKLREAVFTANAGIALGGLNL